MGKIVLELEEFAKTHAESRVLMGSSLTIGRAFTNDLILKDPFVAAVHVQLKYSESGWVCEDMGSVNGVYLSRSDDPKQKIRVQGQVALYSGDTIWLGKSCMRFFDAYYPVAPEEKLEPEAVIRHDPWQQSVGQWALHIISCMVLAYFSVSQWQIKIDNLEMVSFMGSIFVLISLLFWAGGWSLVTRFSRREARFSQHMITAMQITIVAFIINVAERYVNFLLCHMIVITAVTLVVMLLMTYWTLNSHLAIATLLKARQRKIVALSISVALVVLIVLSMVVKYKDFDPTPNHFASLVPFPASLTHTVSIDQSIRDLKQIF